MSPSRGEPRSFPQVGDTGVQMEYWVPHASSSTYIPGQILFEDDIMKINLPELRIHRDELSSAVESEFFQDVLSALASDEEKRIFESELSTWVDEKFRENELELTPEAREALLNILALVMKRVDDLFHIPEE